MNLEPFMKLSEAIISHWNSEKFDENLLQIQTSSEQVQNFIY